MKCFWPNERFLADAETLQAWKTALSYYSYEEIAAAIQRCIFTCKYQPTIAHIVDAININKSNNSINIDAWGNVQNAIRKYGMYREIEAVESLDNTTRRIIKSIGWKNICTSDNPDIVRAQFRKAYEQIAAEQKTRDIMPEQLRQNISKQISNSTGQLETGGNIPEASEDRPEPEYCTAPAEVLQKLRTLKA